MKKFSILIVLVAVLLPVQFTFAQQVSKKNQTQVSNQSKKIHLAYEKIWFAGLNKKQQQIYLQTMEKLAYKLSTNSTAGVDALLLQKLFMNPAEARTTISNGFIYEGSLANFYSSLNLGSLRQDCPSGQLPCAPYTGLVRVGGEYKVPCSPNVTATCVQLGNRDLLQGALVGCAASTSAFCVELSTAMRTSTQGVENWCNQNDRGSKNYCRSAMAALTNSDVPLPPTATGIPSGSDCEELSRKMAEAKDKNRDASESGASNNSFWRGMTGFAQQACGRPSVTSTMNIVGLCDLNNMEAPEGGLRQPGKTVIYTRQARPAGTVRGSAVVNAEKYDECVAGKLAELPADDTEARQKRRSYYYSEPTRTCVAQTTEQIKGPNGNPVRQELELSEIMSLAPRFRAGAKLSQDEENKFIAATGMRSGQFRQAFCNSTSQNQFVARMKQFGGVPVDLAGQGSIVDLLKGQSAAARYKMARCVSNLKSVKNTGCRYYDVTDFNVLRAASPNNPVLARNKKDNSCSLVVGLSRSQAGFNTASNGTKVPIIKTSVRIQNPGQEKMMDIKSESHFAKDNEIKVYRCDGDQVPGVKYQSPDSQGESEARSEF